MELEVRREQHEGVLEDEKTSCSACVPGLVKYWNWFHFSCYSQDKRIGDMKLSNLLYHKVRDESH